VRFACPAANRDTLHGVDLCIPAGQTIALDGETGAGRSTLVKLLARYDDVSGGRDPGGRDRPPGLGPDPDTDGGSSWFLWDVIARLRGGLEHPVIERGRNLSAEQLVCRGQPPFRRRWAQGCRRVARSNSSTSSPQ
jgi:energy-coupling factor transporter ATP-binding protein EcfA2